MFIQPGQRESVTLIREPATPGDPERGVAVEIEESGWVRVSAALDELQKSAAP